MLSMRICPILLFCGLIWAPAARSHHSFATHYDSDTVVEITGVITDVRIRSPHSFFTLDVVDDKGQAQAWDVEAHALPLLRRLGIEKDTIEVGDQVTFRGPRSRRPEKNLLFGALITTASGDEYEMLQSFRRPPAARTIDQRQDVAGIERLTGKWLTFISGQRVAESPMPLNARGIAARASFDPQHNAASDCIPSNLPSLLMIPYLYQISVDGDRVGLYHEYARIDRSVSLGAEEPEASHPNYGARRARFENDTLVVETSGFPALSAGLASGWEPNGNGKDIPSSPAKTLVERYRVNADGSELILDYTVTDPAYLTEPFSARVVYHRVPDSSPLYEFECDADIARRSTLNAVPTEP